MHSQVHLAPKLFSKHCTGTRVLHHRHQSPPLHHAPHSDWERKGILATATEICFSNWSEQMHSKTDHCWGWGGREKRHSCLKSSSFQPSKPPKLAFSSWPWTHTHGLMASVEDCKPGTFLLSNFSSSTHFQGTYFTKSDLSFLIPNGINCSARISPPRGLCR